VLVFGTVPAGATVIGGAVILVSTLLLARHESRVSAPVKESAPEAK
jgi:drug/metabolite transporter (DMT)-like permease